MNKAELFFYRLGFSEGYSGIVPQSECAAYTKGYRKGVKIYIKQLRKNK